AVGLANRLAPAPLELMVSVPAALGPRVRHAGAVFVGGHTPEVVGDYVAGPNHVLRWGAAAASPRSEYSMTLERLTKSSVPSGDAKRAVPAVGRTWLGPAT